MFLTTDLYPFDQYTFLFLLNRQAKDAGTVFGWDVLYAAMILYAWSDNQFHHRTVPEMSGDPHGSADMHDGPIGTALHIFL